MGRAELFAVVALAILLTASCETDSDWVAANPGRPDYLPTQYYIGPCGGLNDSQWTRLMYAPPEASIYLRHAEAATLPEKAGRRDTWYRRNPGQVLLCRAVEASVYGGYNALWRFREQDGEVVVAGSYAWQYVMVN